MPARAALLGDAAIAVLAERGMRGLTHRAVDATAGVPDGSTSYYARTRAELLDLVLRRLTELDEADFAAVPGLPTVDSVTALADVVACFLADLLAVGHTRTLARYELALEATRRPELREEYDRAGTMLREQAAGLLAAVGSADPQRHAWMLVTWCDGVLFYSVAGAGGAPMPAVEQLRRSAFELLTGMTG